MISSALTQSLQVINVRVTFRKAPIHILERFAFKELEFAHKILLKETGLQECTILQTCNRVEIFGSGKNPDEKKLIKVWAEAVGLSSTEFDPVIEVSYDKDVVLHLMKLASGLDSLVVGEDQILGQVKRGFEYSRKNHFAGSNLSMLFEKAVKVGSKVRTTTGVNKGSVSIGSMAVNLASEYFRDLKNIRVMLVGSGEGAALVAKALKQRGVNFAITSRTFERAKSFSDTVAGNPIPFESALNMLSEFDLIFVSTTAPYYLITSDRIQKAISKRNRPLMIFDLSNPRTVEEDIAALNQVKLVNIDQIAEIVEENLKTRKREVLNAEKIIEMEIKSVDNLLKRKQAEPIIISIFKNVDSIRERELQKAINMIGQKIGPEEYKIVEQLSYAIVEGILSAPMNNLRKELEIDDKNPEELVKIITKLFKYEIKH